MGRPMKSPKRRKRFPCRCPECWEVAVRPTVIPYDAKFRRGGRVRKVRIPRLGVLKCSNCGEVLFGNEAGDQIDRAIKRAGF